jgi:hypothetical protein
MKHLKAAIREGIDGSVVPLNRKGEDPTPANAFPRLRDLLNDPELLKPPEPVLPYLAYSARATVLVGPDKSGKSTLAGHGVAAMTRGLPFLGQPTRRGNVVVVAPDEATGETVRRLKELGADPDAVRVLTLRPPDLLATLDALLDDEPHELVVVDSLAEYARLMLGRAPEDGDSSGWGTVTRPLVELTRTRGCSLLLLHHPRRSDGQYRGSGEIAASVDCLLEMTLPNSGEDPTLRRFRGRARWPMQEFSVRLRDEVFEIGDGGEIPIEARIVLDVASHPGTSRNASHQRIGGRKQAHVAAVNNLLQDDRIRERSGGLFIESDVEGVLL